MENRQEKAVELFIEGYNCAQAVFAAYADIYGIDKDTALRLTSSMGAGMGRMREVCGAVSSMFLLAGLGTGTTDSKDRKGKTENYELVRKMADEFKQCNGGTIICKELLGLTKAEVSAQPLERTDMYYKKRPCIKLVRSAASIVEQYL